MSIKMLEFFKKYWKGLGMPPKTSKLTVMHLKPFKSRFSHFLSRNFARFARSSVK